MQTGNIKFFIIILLLITGCAKTDINILQKDISRYSAIEEELNIKIKLVNNQMIKAIEKYKNTKAELSSFVVLDNGNASNICSSFSAFLVP